MPNISVMIKPASGLCNMRCKYCFYADEMASRETANYGIMSHDTMEQVISKTIAYADTACTFAFQGGEPTLAGLDFFKDVIAMQKKHNPRGIRIQNAIQTNGYAINEDWARFFGENHFLVGVSLDGPKEIHNRYRLDAAGEGTFGTVVSAIRLLEEHHVDFNILTVVTGTGAKSIGKINGFFARNGWRYQQYISCLNPMEDPDGQYPFSLSPAAMSDYLCRLFDLWYRDAMANKMHYNRFFNNLLAMVSGQPPESCNMMGHCSRQYVVEADGGVYPCDFYVVDAYRLGNFNTDDFPQLDAKREDLQFIQASRPLPQDCRSCQWIHLCRNGCRRDREVLADGSLGKNRYCSAYQTFYAYAVPRLVTLLREIQSGRIQYFG